MRNEHAAASALAGPATQRARTQRIGLRRASEALHAARRRPDSDPRPRTVQRAEADQRNAARTCLGGRPASTFTSWLSLAPGNKISGGRVLSSKTRRSANRAAALLRLAATTLGPDRYGFGRVLPPLVRTRGQGQGGDRHGPQDRRPLLQYDALRHAVRRPWRLAL